MSMLLPMARDFLMMAADLSAAALRWSVTIPIPGLGARLAGVLAWITHSVLSLAVTLSGPI